MIALQRTLKRYEILHASAVACQVQIDTDVPDALSRPDSKKEFWKKPLAHWAVVALWADLEAMVAAWAGEPHIQVMNHLDGLAGQTHKARSLFDQLDEISKFRNWIAHGYRSNRPPSTFSPGDVERILRDFLDELGILSDVLIP